MLGTYAFVWPVQTTGRWKEMQPQQAVDVPSANPTTDLVYVKVVKCLGQV